MVQAVDLVDEEDLSALEVGQDGGQVARPLEDGPAVGRIATSSSLAMTCASDVLPRPGGP